MDRNNKSKGKIRLHKEINTLAVTTKINRNFDRRSWEIMKILKEKAQAQKKHRSILLFSSLLLGAMIVAQAYFIVTIVDRIFLQGASVSELLPEFGGLLLVLLGRGLFTYINGRTGVRMASIVKKEFRAELLAKFRRNPMQASLKGQSGEKVSVMMDSIDEIEAFYTKYYPQMIQTTFVPIIILIAVFSVNWVSGLTMVITAPFIPIFMIIIGQKTQKKSEEQMEKLAAFSGRFLDTLQGLSTLKYFGRSKEQLEGIRESSINYREATMDVLKIAFLSTLMMEFVSMLSMAIIALEVGLRLVIYNQLSFFTAFFVLVLAPEYYTSLKELGSAFHAGRGSTGAAKRVTSELEQEEQPVEWGENRLLINDSPPSIEFKRVGFNYGEGSFALKEISAEIAPFKEVAIVGKSGAGKTTFLHLLSGLVSPSKGEIIVDGRPLFSYQESAWFDQIGYISQNPYLFSGTIAENIAVGGTSQSTRAEIVIASEKAGIAELVEGLDDGYDTFVGEGGRGLSGGEKQRVALARAFLKMPSVVIFDEPTVGLDLQTERILQRSIKELAKSSTIITVAHRLHTIKNADQILFLAEGSLVASGTHEDLVTQVPDYAEMVAVQQGGDAS